MYCNYRTICKTIYDIIRDTFGSSFSYAPTASVAINAVSVEYYEAHNVIRLSHPKSIFGGGRDPSPFFILTMTISNCRSSSRKIPANTILLIRIYVRDSTRCTVGTGPQ